jgi:phosphodiesterase/alkaline phosphatase D-like protein
MPWRLVTTALGLLATGLVLASPAIAAAPTAITGPVQAVGGTTATVRGTVNPGGQATTWHFEYGTTTSYGQTTATSSAGSGSANVDVASSLAGLSTGTTYHYRLVAENSAGTSRGADGVFTTDRPPTVTTGSASGIAATSATVAGTVDPNGLSTSWFVEYGTTTAYGSKTTTRDAGNGTNAVDVSADLSGLTPGTTYHYRVVGTNSAGTGRGADRTLQTPGNTKPDVRRPTVTNIGTTSARLNGQVDPNGRPTTWYFEYGTTTALGSRTSDGNAGSGTTHRSVSVNLSRLQPGTTYFFRIVARSDAGTTVGATLSFTTLGAPLVVTGSASKVLSTSATVSGSVNPNGRSTSYWFEYGTTTSYGSRSSSRNAGSGTSSLGVARDLTGLAPGTVYHFRLVAQNSSGTARGADRTFSTVATAGVGTPQIVEVRPTSARIVVGVDTRGQTTTVVLEYGQRGDFSSRSGPVSLSGSAREAAFELSGLPQGRRTYVRAVASSSLGTTVGAAGSFSTPVMPTRAAGRPIRCTLVGTQGPDRLRGTIGRDVICGLGGNDRIEGLDGADVLIGGPGDDRLVGSDGNDVLVGGAGRDEVVGGVGADHLEGGEGLDRLLGGPGNDMLLGGSLGDVLLGGAGNDVMRGGSGNDVLLARDGRRDIVDGGPGRNSARVDRVLDRVSRVRLI